jgi:hypothetical protein
MTLSFLQSYLLLNYGHFLSSKSLPLKLYIISIVKI